MNFVDVCIDQVLNSLDGTAVPTVKEKRFLSSMVCKNLADLCETGRAILEDMKSKGVSIENLPNSADIETCQSILSRFYDDSMFEEDDDVGIKPNWSAVASFEKRKGDGACKIYRCIKNNVIEKPIGKEIQKAAQNRDVDFFVRNFDLIFANVPFEKGLIKFKNFVASNAVTTDHQEYVWDFFDSLLDIFIHEQETLEDLNSC
jgi:hypothetical protein